MYKSILVSHHIQNTLFHNKLQKKSAAKRRKNMIFGNIEKYE